MPEILHYPGPMPGLDLDQMIGPDVGRRYMAIKSADYDEATDVTTLTLRPIMPDELRERVTPLIEQQRRRQRIRELFNA